jgi:hypothetical protein
MYYSIEANVKTRCDDRFPEGLSHFFEQIGGYGEKSMVSQVEKVLKIDLSLFQHYDFVDNPKPSSAYWIEIKKMQGLLSTLNSKIRANPNYHTQLKYDPVEAIYGFSTDSAENERMNKTQQDHQKHPMFGYPNDHGYLSTSAFTEDISALETLLKCYSKNGATKVRLSYN